MDECELKTVCVFKVHLKNKSVYECEVELCEGELHLKAASVYECKVNLIVWV